MGLGGNQYKAKQAAQAGANLESRDPLLDFLEGVSEYAPAAGAIYGTALGGTVGGIAGSALPGAGTLAGIGAGAALGGSLGGTAGQMAKTWGDDREFDRQQAAAEAEQKRMQDEEDQRATIDAAKIAKMQAQQGAVNKEQALIDLIGRFL
jgi:hypothetical protein